MPQQRTSPHNATKAFARGIARQKRENAVIVSARAPKAVRRDHTILVEAVQRSRDDAQALNVGRRVARPGDIMKRVAPVRVPSLSCVARCVIDRNDKVAALHPIALQRISHLCQRRVRVKDEPSVRVPRTSRAAAAAAATAE